MPQYHDLPVLDKIDEVVALHRKKPLAETDARTVVGKILTTYSKRGIDNAKSRLKFVQDTQADAKRVLARMEQLLEELEAPNYIPEMYKLPEAKAGLQIIETLAKSVHDDGATMYDLMGQYRANWTATIQKVCPTDIGFVDSHIAIRTRSMTLGKQAVAVVDRIDEYAKRAEQVVKDAEKARKGGERSTKEAVDEANGLLKLLETAQAESAERLRKSTQKMKSMASMKTQKVYTGKEHKVAESFVQDIETERKAIAGLNKSSLQNYARLEALAKARAFILKPQKETGQAAMEATKKNVETAREQVADAGSMLAEYKKRIS